MQWELSDIIYGHEKHENIGQFLIKLHINLPEDPANPLLGIHTREIKTYWHKDLYVHVESSFMHTATNWEKMSWVLSTARINCVKRTNKWYAHIRLKSTYAKWRKLDKRENILCGCIYVKFKKSQNYCNRKQISDC